MLKESIAGALMAFLGALSGSYLTSYFEQKNWEERFVLEQKKKVLEKRIELIESTVRVFNRAATVEGLRGTLQAEKDYVLLKVQCSTGSASLSLSKACKDIDRHGGENIERVAKEIHALNADFSAIMSLDKIYFGAKTQKAVDSLMQGDPWLSSEDKKQALLSAMANEMDKF
ncbi:hypothetical protein SMQE13_16740 [Serratia marcescens]|nr:hypothetical protein SMQE13_16740 [Serratia marcescens]